MGEYWSKFQRQPRWLRISAYVAVGATGLAIVSGGGDNASEGKAGGLAIGTSLEPSPVTTALATEPVAEPTLAPPPAKPAARPVAIRALTVRSTRDRVRVRYSWVNGAKRVRWRIELRARGAGGALSKTITGAGAPGARTLNRSLALSPAWAGRRVTARLVLRDAIGTTARAKTVSVPAPPPPPGPAAPTPSASCDPNYAGACLDPNASDYDCAGGSGDGPKYTGPVRVVGSDPHGLDRDGDGVACEN